MYPTDAGVRSKSYQRFILPLSAFRLLGDCFAIMQDYRHQIPTYATRVCACIHSVGLAAHVLPSFALVWLNVRRANSWAQIKAFHIFKGVDYFITICLLRYFGPPPGEVYPHNTLGFAAAFARGLTTLAIFTLWLTPRNRQHVAVLFSNTVFHVTVSLETLRDATFNSSTGSSSEDGGSVQSRPRIVWADRSESLTESDEDKRERSSSHHTAKLSGPMKPCVDSSGAPLPLNSEARTG